MQICFVQKIYYLCCMEEQETLRKELKIITDYSVSGLAIKWDIDPVYLHRFANGMKVGKKVHEKIQNGVMALKKEFLK
jgi:hypothetical protein